MSVSFSPTRDFPSELDSLSIQPLPHSASLSLSLSQKHTLFLEKKEQIKRGKKKREKKDKKQGICSGLFGKTCSEIISSMERTSFHYLN